MPNRKYRKNVRLRGYDYASEGYYFVTICTRRKASSYEREQLFEPRASKRFGHEFAVAATHASPQQIKRNTDLVEKCLLEIPKHYPEIEVDFYVIMPDHLHIILVIKGAACRAATKRSTLGNVIGSFKSAASQLANKSLWQPNFYEHIIRDSESLDRIRTYLLNNPEIEYADINWNTLDPNQNPSP